MFHDIGVDDPNKFSVSAKRFIDIMEWHMKNEYEFISIDEWKSGCCRNKKCIITFDDGKNNFFEIYPYLQAHSIPFCLYMISAKIGENEFITKDELRKLSNDPLCTVGAHTKNHDETRYLTEEVLTEELVDCKAFLEKTISKPVIHFAFPHGDLISTSLFDEKYVKKMGYKTAAKTKQVPLRCTTRQYSLPRVDASRKDILEVL